MRAAHFAGDQPMIRQLKGTQCVLECVRTACESIQEPMRRKMMRGSKDLISISGIRWHEGKAGEGKG